MNKQLTPILKIFIFIVFLMMGMGIASAIIAASLSNFNIADLSSNLVEHPFELLASQGVIHLCMFIIAPLLFVTYIEKKNINTFFGFEVGLKINYLLYSVVILFSMQAVTSGASEYSRLLPFGQKFHEYFLLNQELNDSFTEAILNDTSLKMFMLQIFTMGILAGIGEEMVFRGIFQNLFYQWTHKIHLSILFSAILFAVFHGMIYNIFGIVLIGILFGYIYHYTRNLWVTIGIHILNNISIVIISYLNTKGIIHFDISKTDQFNLLEISISGLITIFAMYRFSINRNCVPKL